MFKMYNIHSSFNVDHKALILANDTSSFIISEGAVHIGQINSDDPKSFKNIQMRHILCNEASDFNDPSSVDITLNAHFYKTILNDSIEQNTITKLTSCYCSFSYFLEMEFTRQIMRYK